MNGHLGIERTHRLVKDEVGRVYVHFFYWLNGAFEFHFKLTVDIIKIYFNFFHRKGNLQVNC